MAVRPRGFSPFEPPVGARLIGLGAGDLGVGAGALVRAVGIEPTPQAWEAHVLPLNYARSWRPVADWAGPAIAESGVQARKIGRKIARPALLREWRNCWNHLEKSLAGGGYFKFTEDRAAGIA